MAIMERDRRGRMQMNEFYESIGANRGFAATNEMLYISSHTIYLQDGINYKREILRNWREIFGERLNDDAWEYVAALYPSFCIISIIEDMKAGRGISREYVRWKTIVRLEMDLKLIECAENNVTFNMNSFRHYINEKYNFAFDTLVDEIEDGDIPYIENFPALGNALMKFQKDIKSVFENLIKSCEEALNLRINSSERNSRRRRRSRTPRVEEKQTPAPTSTPAPEPAPVASEPEKVAPKVTDTEEKTVEEVAPPKVEPETKPETPVVTDENATSHAIKDYEVIIAECEDRIKRLESDVAEFQRRHDEMREYSLVQYDRGIKTLFNALNDKRYSKPLDFLYKMMINPALDDNFRSYLENLFMALKDMDIEPIIENPFTATIDETRLTTNYNLEFDKKNFIPEKTKIKYVGWKYKNSILEKPTLSVKE